MHRPALVSSAPGVHTQLASKVELCINNTYFVFPQSSSTSQTPRKLVAMANSAASLSFLLYPLLFAAFLLNCHGSQERKVYKKFLISFSYSYYSFLIKGTRVKVIFMYELTRYFFIFFIMKFMFPIASHCVHGRAA